MSAVMFADILYPRTSVSSVFAIQANAHYSRYMGNFRILLLTALLGISPAVAVTSSPPTTAQSLTVASRVTLNLLPMLEGKEITPLPLQSVCTALATRADPDDQPLVPPGAHLLNADIPEDEIMEVVTQALALSFAGSGLKLGKDLVLLTGKLTWVSQGQARVMVATFERGPFAGFFDSRTQQRRERLLFAVSGTQVCVAPG
jgi:hypothetical protein